MAISPETAGSRLWPMATAAAVLSACHQSHIPAWNWVEEECGHCFRTSLPPTSSARSIKP